jgi:hypothetical protein
MQAVNINFVNNNGTQQDIATLGFAVKSSKYASLYGKSDCPFPIQNDIDTMNNRLPGQR